MGQPAAIVSGGQLLSKFIVPGTKQRRIRSWCHLPLGTLLRILPQILSQTHLLIRGSIGTT
jgi:hypothetical protein